MSNFQIKTMAGEFDVTLRWEEVEGEEGLFASYDVLTVFRGVSLEFTIQTEEANKELSHNELAEELAWAIESAWEEAFDDHCYTPGGYRY